MLIRRSEITDPVLELMTLLCKLMLEVEKRELKILQSVISWYVLNFTQNVSQQKPKIEKTVSRPATKVV